MVPECSAGYEFASSSHGRSSASSSTSRPKRWYSCAPRASAPQALGMDEKTAEAILVADPRLNAVLQSLPLSVEMPTDGVDPRAEAANAQVSMPFLF